MLPTPKLTDHGWRGSRKIVGVRGSESLHWKSICCKRQAYYIQEFKYCPVAVTMQWRSVKILAWLVSKKGEIHGAPFLAVELLVTDDSQEKESVLFRDAASEERAMF